MATKTITVRIDEDVKNQAELILDEIGITVTALFNACLKALVREKKVPFDLVSNEYEFITKVNEKLAESLAMASDQSSKRYTHDDIFQPLRKKHGYEI